MPSAAAAGLGQLDAAKSSALLAQASWAGDTAVAASGSIGNGLETQPSGGQSGGVTADGAGDIGSEAPTAGGMPPRQAWGQRSAPQPAARRPESAFASRAGSGGASPLRSPGGGTRLPAGSPTAGLGPLRASGSETDFDDEYLVRVAEAFGRSLAQLPDKLDAEKALCLAI